MLFHNNYGFEALFCLILFFAFLLTHMGLDGNKDSKEMVMNKRILLTSLWMGNLLLFMSILWGCEYAYHQGVEWIKNPARISLVSCTITKIILTVLAFNAWSIKLKEHQ